MAGAESPLPAAPRDSATVLVGRERSGALEVFCVQRHGRSAFLGGAVVFPGGKLDRSDSDLRWRQRTTAVASRALAFAHNADHGLALAVCACRETLEEGAIIATEPPIEHAAAADLRAAVSRPGASMALLDALERRSLRLDIARLVPFARWITPEVEPRRYDARFYWMALPPGQSGQHDEHETTTSLWGRPAEILAAKDAGKLMLAPPTIRALELLLPATTLRDAQDIATAQSLEPVLPRFVPDDPPMLVIPGDPLHDVPERRVDGPTRFVLRDGRFVSEDPPS